MEKLDIIFNDYSHIKKKHHRSTGKLCYPTKTERSNNGKSLTYGCIEDYSTVINQIPNLSEYTLFYDMGSGIARIVLYVFLMIPTINEIIGIEIVRDRFECSKHNLNNLVGLYPDEYIIIENTINKIHIRENNTGRNLIINFGSIFNYVFDKLTPSIVNSHVIADDVTQYTNLMNTFNNSFILSMYPLNNSVMHVFDTDFDDTTDFYLTNTHQN